MRFEDLNQEERLQVTTLLSQCKSAAAVRTICRLYNISYPNNSSISAFLENRTFHNRTASDVYQEYYEFCKQTNHDPESQIALTKAIKKQYKSLTKSGQTVFIDPSAPTTPEVNSVELFVSNLPIENIESMAAQATYQLYVNFCRREDLTPVNHIRFGREIRKFGYTTTQRKIQGVTYNFYIKRVGQ